MVSLEKSHLDQEAQASGARSAGNRCRSRFTIQLSKTQNRTRLRWHNDAAN